MPSGLAGGLYGATAVADYAGESLHTADLIPGMQTAGSSCTGQFTGEHIYAPDGQEPPVRSLLRCFRGHMELPQDAPLGRWIVYLVVQNINHVPAGTAPEQAATVIGGHVMGPSAQVLGCGFMLLGDHVFDIF